MKKQMTALAAALVLLLVPQAAQAETFYGEDGWSVSFDGTQMTSSFTDAAIEDTLYLMQPGDTADIRLNLRNGSSQATHWYMTNQVLQSLEDSQSVAEGGAYSYRLAYVDSQGEESLLYSSQEVGGETVNASGEGLHQATDSLEDYFYLDTLEAGESGEIRLQVQLEGETQGNAYQNTLAQLQMNFAVELSQGGDSNPSGAEDSPSASTGQVVKTGDDQQMEFYSSLLLLAGLACLCLAVVKMIWDRKKGGRRTDER